MEGLPPGTIMENERWYVRALEHPLGPLVAAVLVLLLIGFLSNLARYAPHRSNSGQAPAVQHYQPTGAERF